jgi:hypothetical protein
MEVPRQDGLETPLYNTPNSFDESVNRGLQKSQIQPVCIQDSGSKAIGSLTGPVFPLSGSQVGSPS